MPIFMGTGAALAFAWSAFTLWRQAADNKYEPTLVGLTMVAFLLGLLLWGLAALFQKFNDERP